MPDPTAATLREVARQTRLTSGQLRLLRENLDRARQTRYAYEQPKADRRRVRSLLEKLTEDTALKAIREVNDAD